MKLREVLLFGGCLAAVTLSTAGPAAADTTDELLKQLRSKGILSEAEYNELTTRKEVEEAREAEEKKAQAAAVADDPSIVRASDKGLGLQVGPVNIGVSGSVNGFYVYDSGDDGANTTVTGGVVSTNGDTSAVRNGLLPGFLRFDITTEQEGLDVGAHFGIYPGIDSVDGPGANAGGNPTALATSGIDFRNVYLTVGNDSIGELKIGRDIGLFGSDAILNDMTLFGVGTAAANSAANNTSLGRIGLGYIYTDFQPQITYTSPKFAGFGVAAGVFQPLRTAGNSEVNDSPGFQGEVTYDFAAGGVNGHLWGSAITQRHDRVGSQAAYTGTGYDVGAKLSYDPVTLTGYYYQGEGIGTTGLFLNAVDSTGNTRDSRGYYVQGTVSPIDKLTLGVSYGESALDLASGEVNPTLVESNRSWVGLVKYDLTDWVSMIGEVTATTSEAHGGNEAESTSGAVGAILFF